MDLCIHLFEVRRHPNSMRHRLSVPRSLVLWTLLVTYRLLSLTSPIRWVEYLYERNDRRLPYLCVELWVVLNLAAQGLALAAIPRGHWLALLIAFYGLADVTLALLRDAVDSPLRHKDKEGGYILIRNRPRWMALTFLGLVEVILCFGILLLAWGEEFKPPISDPITALYHSTVTLTTLGYGDITPNTSYGKLLVIAELFFFVLFLSFRLPLAVSVLRVKVRHR